MKTIHIEGEKCVISVEIVVFEWYGSTHVKTIHSGNCETSAIVFGLIMNVEFRHFFE